MVSSPKSRRQSHCLLFIEPCQSNFYSNQLTLHGYVLKNVDSVFNTKDLSYHLQ
jgi:hypothetical protein